MKKPFWITENNPKDFFKIIKEDFPEATFWDVFTDYQPQGEEPADTSAVWLAQQKELITTIIDTYFTDTALESDQLDVLSETFTEFSLPEEQRYFDDLDGTYFSLVEEIHETHLVPLALNRTTYDTFLYHLCNAIEKNSLKLLASQGNTSVIDDMLAKIPNCSEELKQQMIDNYHKMMAEHDEEASYDNYYKFEKEGDEEDYFEKQDNVIYPQVHLAFSDTFYDENDAGNMPYKTQERIANEKFEVYKAEICSLLAQQPNETLQPKSSSMLSDSQWDAYFDFTEKHVMANEFGNQFTIWNDTTRVLFLTMQKEDKELPYEIKLVGMPLEDYKMLLEGYNTIFST